MKMIKSFLKDSFFYTVANLFTRGIGFVLLPVYTRVISKNEYGLFDYLTAVGAFLAVVLSLEVTQAIFRFIPESKERPDEQAILASTGLWFTLAMHTLFCVGLILFSDYLAVLLFDDLFYSSLVKMAGLLFMANAVIYNFTSILRASLLSKKVVVVSLLNASLVALFSLLFVLQFDMGVKGLVLGQLLGVVITIFISFRWVRPWVRMLFCIRSLKMMLRFSSPLVLSSIGVVLSMFVDRIMLKEFLGAEQLASYAVAIKIASIVTLLMVGFQSALTPLIYANYKNKDTPPKIAKLYHFYLLMACIALVLLSTLSEWLVRFIAGLRYADASGYIPVLVLSALFSSMYLFFPGLSIAKKTVKVSGINIAAGLLNVVLNYIFIPKYGPIGAAFSTLSSVFIAFVANLYCSQNFYYVPIKKGIVFLFFAVSGLVLYVAI